MSDNENMKIKFKNNLVFGWKEVISIVAVIITATGVYWGMQYKIDDAGKGIIAVNDRLTGRAVFVDASLKTINDNIEKMNDRIVGLKTDNAVTQSKLIDLEKNQVAIYQKLESMTDMIVNRNHKDASYKTAGVDHGIE